MTGLPQHPLFGNFSAGRFERGNGGRSGSRGGSGARPPGGSGSFGPGDRPPMGLQTLVDVLIRVLGSRATAFFNTRQTEAEAERLIEDALRELRPELFPPKRTQPEPQRPIQREPDANLVRVGGRIMNVPKNDPLLTGEMISVTSSNVHSIGFDFNHSEPTNGTLKVRFLQSDRSGRGSRGAKVPGPLYQYFDVHPFVFMTMREAASKGKFVWDKLRIRGTVSGHRFRYRLAGISQGYVPRQASLRSNAQEWFQKRAIRSGNQTLVSQLPNELVRRLDTRQMHKILTSGAPYRGSPERAQPFRGR